MFWRQKGTNLVKSLEQHLGGEKKHTFFHCRIMLRHESECGEQAVIANRCVFQLFWIVLDYHLLGKLLRLHKLNHGILSFNEGEAHINLVAMLWHLRAFFLNNYLILDVVLPA